ncbi:DUF202 domain-containing protein [Pedococcus bigeumensis]|uniref:DUF202 domain-containing protein n=1 Tax=Pedococcus bigeumensis TaxID=433644 RepID=A0A502CYF9_9MICO|nr:DUF202 domain-containing protein [Pedococcus bigeumensis]TPG17863.1 DUF202 domain-containing protein [Pedococcus bigeumensis]
MSRIPNRDALQPERTALAWQRTAITSLVLLVPLVMVALRLDVPVLAGLGAGAMGTSVVLVVSVRRRFAQLGDDSRGYSPYPPMIRVAFVTVLGALGGATLGLTLWLR